MIGFWHSWKNFLEISTRAACLLISGSQVRALVRPPRKKPSCPIASRNGGREQSGSRPTFFVWTDTARLLCGFSFVSVSSPHSIQRADPTVQVDYVLVVEWDIRASKTDNLV